MASHASDSVVPSTQLPASMTRAKHRSRRKQLASAMAVSFQALPVQYVPPWNKQGKERTMDERRRFAGKKREERRQKEGQHALTYKHTRNEKNTHGELVLGPNAEKGSVYIYTCNHRRQQYNRSRTNELNRASSSKSHLIKAPMSGARTSVGRAGRVDFPLPMTWSSPYIRQQKVAKLCTINYHAVGPQSLLGLNTHFPLAPAAPLALVLPAAFSSLRQRVVAFEKSSSTSPCAIACTCPVASCHTKTPAWLSRCSYCEAAGDGVGHGVGVADIYRCCC